MEALIIIPLVVMVILGIRIVAGSCDKDRVETYIRERGHKLLNIRWSPLGPGWFGEQDSRIYWVQYRDSMGNRHEAYAKTSMLSGVYLTEDRIVESSFLMNKPRRNSPPSGSNLSGESFSNEEKLERKSRVLEEENEWLRRRIQDLERQSK
jgi:hypothetical protein